MALARDLSRLPPSTIYGARSSCACKFAARSVGQGGRLATPEEVPMCPTCAPPRRPLRPFAELPTDELVAAACEGATQAWAEIVLRYERLVLGVVGSFRLQEADAADAAASTWLRAMEGLAALRDPDRLGGWLRTIARRECLGLLRQTVLEEPSDVAAAST